jgi:hypothetical protein
MSNSALRSLLHGTYCGVLLFVGGIWGEEARVDSFQSQLSPIVGYSL